MLITRAIDPPARAPLRGTPAQARIRQPVPAAKEVSLLTSYPSLKFKTPYPQPQNLLPISGLIPIMSVSDFKTPCKAIISYSAEDWRLQDVLVREPREHEVLVKITAVGICHTDVQNVGGIYPRVLGHEGSYNI